MTTEAIILPHPPLSEPATPAARRRHWEMLIISALAIALSFLLTIRDDGRVALRGMQQYAAPESCLSHSFFGVDCPGCGLTRSFITLARGDLAASVRYHWLGWMMALAVLLQLPYRALGLWTNRTINRRAGSIFGYTLIASLFIQWAIRSLT